MEQFETRKTFYCKEEVGKLESNLIANDTGWNYLENSLQNVATITTVRV